jgi:hypothetical protein
MTLHRPKMRPQTAPAKAFIKTVVACVPTVRSGEVPAFPIT